MPTPQENLLFVERASCPFLKMTPHLSLKEEGRHDTDSETDKQIGNGGNGIAVSLPPNNHEHSMRDVTIARLIFGKRPGVLS
ncbi:hypothetical protein AVDCRST_MAG84-12 [uncultured Microcoleus sp.]|uniref:Uncharacterized protein n=1 Tax=uncultured Microcoleus sp. TaxID=259945 RepID=A0A6J4KAB1_9CYAN|nr:hypothetical protein AVDCRST_MAG84-12 [uncultured Microcoleus sp.]